MAESSPNGMSLDDVSTSTPNTKNQFISYEGEEKEFVVKFLFRPSPKANINVAKSHYDTLHVIMKVFPEIEIFNNYGQSKKAFKKLMSYNDYLRNFKLHYSKGNELKQRNPIYVAIHRFRSRISLSEIRRHTDVSDQLLITKGRMTIHPWSEDDLNVSNLGFFVGTDASNVINEEMIKSIQDDITKANIPLGKVPEFKCNFSSPFTYTSENNRLSTKAYDLQCRQADAKTMIGILMQTYAKNPRFIFHKMRHTKEGADTYKKSIIRQNLFLSRSRIVPIEGVHHQAMFYVELKLRQIPGVGIIAKHKKWATRGRYSIHTTERNFDEVVRIVRANLAAWTEEAVQRENIDVSELHVSTPRLCFRSEIPMLGPDEEHEDSEAKSFQSYVSACSTLYTNKSNSGVNGTYDLPPATSTPVMQAWSTAHVQIPTVVETKTVVTTDTGSQITQEDYDKLRARNERLENELMSLKDKFELLMTKQSNDDARIALIVREAMRAERDEHQSATTQASTNDDPTTVTNKRPHYDGSSAARKTSKEGDAGDSTMTAQRVSTDVSMVHERTSSENADVSMTNEGSFTSHG